MGITNMIALGLGLSFVIAARVIAARKKQKICKEKLSPQHVLWDEKFALLESQLKSAKRSNEWATTLESAARIISRFQLLAGNLLEKAETQKQRDKTKKLLEEIQQLEDTFNNNFEGII